MQSVAGEPVHHGALTFVLAKSFSGGTACPSQLQYGPGSAQPLLRWPKIGHPQSCLPEPDANVLMSAFELGSWSMY